MIEKLNRAGSDELVRGSLVLFIGIVIFNFFNYVFQISMAKLLGPADFGILAALMSIIYILSIPGEAIQTVVSKYTSKFIAQKNVGKIKELAIRSAKRGIIFAAISFIILSVLSLFFAKLIKIELGLLLITGLFSFYVFLVPIGRGILQGEKRFTTFGVALILESLSKVFICVLLVLLGLRVYGAIGGVLISCALGFLIVFAKIKNVLKSKQQKDNFSGLYKKSIPVLAAVTAIVFMYSLDILVAKALFEPEIAGQYAFVSLIGKIIIFISFSIGRVMFSLSSEKYEKGDDTKGNFKKSLFLVSGVSVFILIFYYLIPEIIVRIVSLDSEQYVSAAHILFRLGAAYSMLSVANIIILYKISVNKIRNGAFVLLGFALIQTILLIMSGSNLNSFANAFLFSNILIFAYAMIIAIRK